MRVGIYGGTFSPVHNGHVAAAKAFMEQMWLDILYVIPTGTSPHKEMDGEATGADRLEMCRLAFADVEGVIVSDCEIRRSGKSYTVDTLREFYAPEHRLFLLCGTDMMLTLDTWYQADEKGRDVNASINVLTSQEPTPLAKGNPQHTNLVEVRKI